MTNDTESQNGTCAGDSKRGKPPAFARDIIRVQDEPITLNYHRGGVYKAQCPECGEWYKWHREAGAKKEAERCCRYQHTDTDQNELDQ